MKNSTKVKNGPPRGIVSRIQEKPCETKQKRRMRVHDPETVRCKVTLYQKPYKTLQKKNDHLETKSTTRMCALVIDFLAELTDWHECIQWTNQHFPRVLLDGENQLNYFTLAKSTDDSTWQHAVFLDICCLKIP